MKGFSLFGPDFYIVRKYSYSLSLSRGKTWRQLGTNISKTLLKIPTK